MDFDRKEAQLIRLACRYIVKNHPIEMDVISDTTGKPTGETVKLTNVALPWIETIITKCTNFLNDGTKG